MAVAQGHPALWVLVVGFIVIVALLYAIVTLVGVPVLALLNRLFARRENSTAESEQNYLLGTVTLAIKADGIGEVMVVGNGRARQTYPARSYDQGASIAQGTSIVVIKMSQGIAYVQPVKLPAKTSD